MGGQTSARAQAARLATALSESAIHVAIVSDHALNDASASFVPTEHALERLRATDPAGVVILDIADVQVRQSLAATLTGLGWDVLDRVALY